MHFIEHDIKDVDLYKAGVGEGTGSFWLAWELASGFDAFKTLLAKHAAFHDFLDETGRS